jgi:endonuclease/exonuclease/phosphatase family metal-dependent hydrolase
MRRLRVVSWNVGRVYTPTSNNRLDDADIPRVARVLDELDPDVVLLQEFVHPGQLAELLAHLPWYAGAMSERCLYDRHVAALARADLAPRFEQHRLEPTGRGLVLVTFSVGEERGAALPVHFDVFDKQRRRSQAESVLELVDARAESLVVVGGDFNLDPDFAARLGDGVDVGTYSLLADLFLEAGRAAGPTLFGFLRVDHLMARGAAVGKIVTRVSRGRRLPLGDHDPLVTDVELVDAARRSA